MIKRRELLVILFIVLFGLNLNAVNIEYQVDLNSNYIWRGFDLNPSHKPVIQPSVTFKFEDCGFGVNIWSSISFEDKDTNELDFTLFYNFRTSENFSLSAGFINYGWYFPSDFDFKDNTTQEVYVSLGLPNFFLSPELSVYYDINNGKGLYLLGSIGRSIKFSDKYSLDISVAIGYNGGQWINGSGLSDVNLTLAVPLKIGKISFTPTVNYTYVLIDEVSKDDHLWFGVSIVF